MKGLSIPRPSPEAVFAFAAVGAGAGFYNAFVAGVPGVATAISLGVATFLAGRHAR